MTNKNILVTGGMGFVGSYLVDELIQRGHRVRIFDNLDPQVHPNRELPDYANPHAEFIQGDTRHSIADISRIKKTLGFKPSVSFQHGMEELVEWGRDREAIDGFAKAQDALQHRGLI